MMKKIEGYRKAPYIKKEVIIWHKEQL
jgi:hypothetical protein